jgi:gas vesicle protein
MYRCEQLLRFESLQLRVRNMNMSQIDIKKAAGFLLAGAAVGAGIALLYAPQSGAQTKKDIRRFARNTVDRLDGFQADIQDHVADWVDDISGTLKDGVARGKKLGEDGCAKVLKSFDNAKQFVEDGKSRVEHMISERTT